MTTINIALTIICTTAINKGLASTSTEFWTGQRASGLEAYQYLNLLAGEDMQEEEDPCAYGCDSHY